MIDNLQEKASLKFFLIDSHEIFLGGTIEFLRSQYPQAEIITFSSAENVLHEVSISQPDLVVMDIYLPEKPDSMSRNHTGMQLLRNLMNSYPKLNIVIQSTHIQTLVRMRHEIDAHLGGFTIVEKSLSSNEMLTRVSWALQGLTHTKDIRGAYSDLEFKPEWMRLLSLAFQDGLQDKAIAKHICVSERMVRHYWDKLQDALGLDCEDLKTQGKNIRIMTQIRAREAGLID
jgi:DNA-binding NarL/FixJ family response regulator